MKSFELIVIGGGPAGITLAKMLGKKMKTAIIRPEDYSMIYCAMPYAIEGILPVEKTLKRDSLITDAGAELLRNTVTDINYKKKTLTLDDDSTLAYDKLVIATGANPIIPNIEGKDLQGVLSFKTQNDLTKILNHVDAGGKHAVVVGAGAIGIELAQALKEKGLQVDLVDMADSILPNMLDSEMAEKSQEELIRTGINLHFGARVTELSGVKYVNKVHLDNGDIIDFGNLDQCSFGNGEEFTGFVVFAVGMKPTLVTKGDLEIGSHGIIVNSKMETGVPDVYAVGDCVQFKSGISGNAFSGKLATNAVPMAKVLGFNLLGQNREYPGFYNGAATKVGKFFIGGTGFSEKTAKLEGFETVSSYSTVTSKFPIMPDAKEVHLKLIGTKKTKRILGAQIVSEEPVTDKIDLLTFAIQNSNTAFDLTKLSYSSQPYQAFYPAANLIVLAAEEMLKKT